MRQSSATRAVSTPLAAARALRLRSCCATFLPALVATVLLSAVAAPLSAQTAPAAAPATHLALPQTPLLPARFGRWQQQTVPTDAAAAAPLTLLSDATMSAIAKEDGVQRTASASYSAPGQSARLTVEALQFMDATGAVASYTYLRQHELEERPADTARHGNTNIASHGAKTVLREGASLVVIEAAGGAAVSSQDITALADTLPKIGGPQGLPPLLPTYLPAGGMVPRSIEYAVGPAGYQAEGGTLPTSLLGFDKAAEVATAAYRGGETGTGRLTLLLLPTPEIAGARGRALEAWLNSPAASDANMGTVRLRRVGPLLALASNGFTPEQSKALLDSIHLRTEVTWNKPVPPEFHVEIRKTASLLTSIMVFSGVGAVAAILLGLFLGFGRAWLRVLMGKPAATEAEFLRLDLRAGQGTGADLTKS